jgi:molybdopterin biosynthesis enzyme MoaB
VTPEATRAVLDREIPGIAELIRAKGLEQTKFSVLSRGLAGSRKQAFILNLPGSPAGAVFSLKAIQELIPHIVQLLHGHTAHS